MFSIEVQAPQWQPISTLSKGSMLIKGRTSDLSRRILQESAQIKALYGCYCWRTPSELVYVGSFSPYKGSQSSLQARLGNYLGNHRIRENGFINTNKLIFDHVNAALADDDITIAYFTSQAMCIGDVTITFDEFSSKPMYVKAIEELLICTYRLNGECHWNRS